MSTSSADLYVGKQCATRYRVVINGVGRSITTDVLERRQIFVTNFGLKVGTANSYSDGVNIDTNMVSSSGSRRETPKLTFGRVGCDRKKREGRSKSCPAAARRRGLKTEPTGSLINSRPDLCLSPLISGRYVTTWLR